MATSTVTDMNLNGGAKQSVNGGRRKSKNELAQKKNKQPKRGMSMAQLESIRTNDPSVGFPTNSTCTPLQNVAVRFRPPPMLVQGIQIHAPNPYSLDPSVIGSSNGSFRFDSSNYTRSCAFDDCVCHKKKRLTGGSSHVNPFVSFSGNNTVVEVIDSGNGKTRRTSGQVTEVMSINRNGGGSRTEFEFFPGKGGGSAEEYKELMMMGSTGETWCGGVGISVGGGLGLGLRGGEGSCVNAVTGSEEGSVSSLDLSLKLSY